MAKIGNKHIIASVVAIVVIAAIIFTVFGTDTFAAKAQNNTIRADVIKDCSSTPWIVGMQLGFFKNASINFVDVGSISEQNEPAALAAGQINVFDGHPNTIINLLQAGVPVKAVAVGGSEPIVQNNTTVDEDHMHYEVLNTSQYQNISDVKAALANGTKIKVGTVATGTCVDLEFNNWLLENGVNMSTIKNQVQYVVLVDPDQEQALKEGQIDIASLHPPFYKEAETLGGINTLVTSEQAFGPAAGMSLLVFTNQYIQEYPGTVRDFTNAYKDYERWVQNNREQAGNITAAFIGLPYTSNVHYYSESGAFDNTSIGYLQQWINAMVQQGDIPAGKYTPQDLYTTEFQDTWKPNLPDN